ncbi:hypothetical protein JX265_003953 [Neoarthrinium moseri]|uniref:Knr4/Smi1-like domain-containing protein n=1 Tax=Neoarthrinium moseri TaxID=1658444 RepID=A0A9Q0AT56_9PEZI|nr:hypothetical protein JX266_001698 [Neoarthrinium moseri]KAI1876427.1 hypothetical protein JX265_003953 [Neoarthrinium moseri]
MTQSFGAAFRSFWHTMTSNDRHSSYDSPYRTGRHMPLNRQSTLTSVATASESRADITSPYADETGRLSSVDTSTAYMGAGMPAPSPVSLTSPGSNGPYSPGLRSFHAKQGANADGFETIASPGEIPMQSFADGLPPAPPVGHSWQRIDNWADENYPELYDQLCEGATSNDMNELEHQLDCSLPQDVRDSLMVHDGQERGGTPTGIIFGSMLLDCEEIVQERDQWLKVNQEFLLDTNVAKPAVPSKAFGGGGSNHASSSRSGPGSDAGSTGSTWRQELMAKQDSVPQGAIQRVYAHPGWIPLVRDWGGNNLAVDLAPGPAGTWGQIILFGRDYDTKYVVAKSWAHFIALVADDLNSGRWFIDEDSNELKLREFNSNRVEPAYFEILRWRMDQKHGRGAKAAAKRKSMVVGKGAASPTASPYASPVDTNGEARGRSLHRLSSPSPLVSPNRPGYGKSSPLARVTEEGTTSALIEPALVTNGLPAAKLVEVETPLAADEAKPSLLDKAPNGDDAGKGKENVKVETTPADKKDTEEVEEGMKTIEI